MVTVVDSAIDKLDPHAVRQRRYERPDEWEHQIESLQQRVMDGGLDLLTPYISDHQARVILGSIAVSLFFKDARIVR